MTTYHWQIAGRTRMEHLTLSGQGIALTSETPEDLLAILRARTAYPEFRSDNFRHCSLKSKQYILSGLAAMSLSGRTAGGKIGVLDFGREGCHEENLTYFHDYRDHGRRLGRGHLFVGTLPTTAICEAAISLHLHGPGYYLNTAGRTEALWQELELLLTDDPALEAVLLFHYTPDHTLYSFLITRGTIALSPDTRLPDLF